jgi:hypothetical protein
MPAATFLYTKDWRCVSLYSIKGSTNVLKNSIYPGSLWCGFIIFTSVAGSGRRETQDKNLFSFLNSILNKAKDFWQSQCRSRIIFPP